MSNSPISPSTSIQRKPDMASAVVETAASEEPREEALAGEDDDPVHPQAAEVTHDDDDGDLQRQADEDVEKVKLAPNPKLPSEKEVEEHNITHWPYRDWCKWCVLARSLGEQRGRKRQGGVHHSVPIIGMDYFFLTSGVSGWQEMLKFYNLDDDEIGRARVDEMVNDRSIVKCLIVCDYASKAVFATVINRKGHDDDEYSVNFILEVVKWLGYTTIIMKSDNEPAMLRLVKVATERLRVKLETVREEHSKEHDSQSHGGTETRIKSVRMMFRTLRLFLESMLGKKIPIFHPALAWLLSYAATLQNIVARGPDGQTPWSQVKGRPFNGRLAAFGELCRWKLPSRGAAVKDKGNMEGKSEKVYS